MTGEGCSGFGRGRGHCQLTSDLRLDVSYRLKEYCPRRLIAAAEENLARSGLELGHAG